MAEPLVVAVMLSRDRPEMAERAARSFFAQTYPNKKLFVMDSSDEPLKTSEWFAFPGAKSGMIYGCRATDNPDSYQAKRGPIGRMRNTADREAISTHALGPDIFIHWDDDDYSHPNRIAEQVALLQASGKECVGYRDMLFWRYDMARPWDSVNCACGNKYWRSGAPCPQCHAYPDGEAWLFQHPSPSYCLGTSLCYWRHVWERRPFPDLPKNNSGEGEDTAWLKGVDSLGVRTYDGIAHDDNFEPRMIASIHGANTMHYEKVLRESPSWRRVPEWDAHCRERMAL